MKELLTRIDQKLERIAFFTPEVRAFLHAQAEAMDEKGRADMLMTLENYFEERAALEAEYKEDKQLLESEVTTRLGRLTSAAKSLEKQGKQMFAQTESTEAEDMLNTIQ